MYKTEELNLVFFPDYEILSELGRGGYAIVFKALQTRLNRLVALKIVKKSLFLDEESIKRFKQEAFIVAQMQHAGVINIYDAGEKDDFYFIVMEILEGGCLKERIRNKGLLDNEEISNILESLLKGLIVIHQKGVIHRDIKSSNIMFSGSGQVVLMDFGISKSESQEQITTDSTFIGTPEYASPEQIDKPAEIDVRTDIYSLGIVAYEMATGYVPFYDKTGNKIKVLEKVLREAPLNPKKINSNLDNKLARIILKCVDKNPDKRYQNAHEMLQSLTGREQLPHKKTSYDKKARFILSGSLIIILVSLTTIFILNDNETTDIEVENFLTPEYFGISLISIKGGVYQLGRHSYIHEFTAHNVKISSFKTSKYEITQKTWTEIMQDNPSNNNGCPECPVENVTWNEVQQFIKKLNELTGKSFRLPTEAEWEIMAKDYDDNKIALLYSGSVKVNDVAVYKENSQGKTFAVGSKNANAKGLYDLSGNVWEWCQDFYSKDTYFNNSRERPMPKDPSGPVKGTERVVRGGGYNNSINDVRIFSRDGKREDYKSDNLGFRIVLPDN